MAKLTINPLVSGFPSVTTLNDNFQAIETALENTLSRDGSTPNHMNADLDMNGNRILNALAQSGDGFIYKGNWTTATSYDINNLVYVPVGTGSAYDGAALICKAAHTSGTLNTDYTAGNWGLLATRGASGAGSGDLVSTNNLSDVANTATARSNLSAAVSGANNDITGLNALTSVPTVVKDTVPFNSVLSKSADYTVALTDRAKLIDYTASGYTLAFPAAATAGDGFVIAVRNSATSGNITLNPNGSETVDGATTITVAAGLSCLVVCNGSNWKTVGLASVAGVSLDHGASSVGSLALLRITTGGVITAGTTVSGSNAYYAPAGGSAYGAVPGGTWRCLGHIDTSLTIDDRTSLFQRIA